jgi:hypothetical protein
VLLPLLGERNRISGTIPYYATLCLVRVAILPSSFWLPFYSFSLVVWQVLIGILLKTEPLYIQGAYSSVVENAPRAYMLC